jgi:hypothetical protein
LVEDLTTVVTPHDGVATPGELPRPHRKRGRPLEMLPQEVLRRIRDLAERGQLFRVHLDTPALYARARRLYGTWAAALGAAGLSHDDTVAAARRRSIETRRRRHAPASR